MTSARNSFGNVRKLPSGRWQARYTNHDGASVSAPMTFDGKGDAQTWLSTVRSDLVRGAWLPADSAITFGTYASTWLAQRTLAPRTREHYGRLLDRLILPTFDKVPMRRLSPATVRDWYVKVDPNRPTQKAHAYAVLKAICATAVADDHLAANPCRIRGAGQSKRVSSTEPASLKELGLLVAAMPERYRLMTLLATWCGLRFGELIELRVKDVDVKAGVVKVMRAVVWTGGAAVIGKPKSDAGVRDVAIPPHLMPAVREHVRDVGKEHLLFPAAGNASVHMRPATLYKVFYPARAAAGRPDLRWHDLRHTGAVLAAATGASLAELMSRMGHSTPAAALRYQHAAKGRDAEIAAALSRLAAGA